MEQLVNDYKCSDCNHCYKMNPSYNLLTESEILMLNNARIEVSFKKGEIIYKQGTPLTHMVILHNGYGKIYFEGPSGINLTAAYTKKFDINGGLGVFTDKRHHSSLVAVTDCDACFIELGMFQEVLRSNMSFMEGFLELRSERVHHIYDQFVLLTQKNMEGRVAESILYLSDHIFENGAINNISNLDLSELTAMTRESTIRVLKEFKNDKIIEVNNHSINILDKKALQNIALHG